MVEFSGHALTASVNEKFTCSTVVRFGQDIDVSFILFICGINSNECFFFKKKKKKWTKCQFYIDVDGCL